MEIFINETWSRKCHSNNFYFHTSNTPFFPHCSVRIFLLFFVEFFLWSCVFSHSVHACWLFIYIYISIILWEHPCVIFVSLLWATIYMEGSVTVLPVEEQYLNFNSAFLCLISSVRWLVLNITVFPMEKNIVPTFYGFLHLAFSQDVCGLCFQKNTKFQICVQ